MLWNAPADLALLKEITKVKRETRMARDNSEDAVSWNVFRYLENAEQLIPLLSWISKTQQSQVELIYWSYSQPANGSWHHLDEARREFGEHLQRSSEPDLIALTDRALFFLEAKLTAPNTTVPTDKTNRKKYLTGGNEWWRQVFTSDYQTVAIDARMYELFRFWLLGTWLAHGIDRDFYLLNIVLSGREPEIERRFGAHMRTAPRRRFGRLTWEEIAAFVTRNAPANPGKALLSDYFKNKTLGYDRFGVLQPAFAPIPNSPQESSQLGSG